MSWRAAYPPSTDLTLRSLVSALNLLPLVARIISQVEIKPQRTLLPTSLFSFSVYVAHALLRAVGMRIQFYVQRVSPPTGSRSQP